MGFWDEFENEKAPKKVAKNVVKFPAKATRGGTKGINGRLLKKSGISSAMLAEWFGYSSAASFRNSSGYEDVLNGVDSVIKHLKG